MTDTPAHGASQHEDVLPPIGSGAAFLTAVTIGIKSARRLASFALAGAAVAVTVALLQPPTYSSGFSFLPQSSTEMPRGGLASLAGQFGISVGGTGQTDSPHLYAELVSTNELLEPLATDSFAYSSNTSERMPLFKLLDVDEGDTAVVVDATVRALRDDVIRSSVATRTSGLVSVRVTTTSAVLSRSLAEKLLASLNEFNLGTRQTQAAAERRFTEGRLNEAAAELRTAEGRLESFLRANRQYQNSPELVFQQDRLQREVTLRQQVVSSLTQQFEEVRIREVRDTPVLTVIQSPTMPVRRDSRRLALKLLLGMFVGTLGGAAIVFVREALQRAQVRNPDAADALRQAVHDLFKGRRA